MNKTLIFEELKQIAIREIHTYSGCDFRDCSHRKGIVLDAFVGSGTTLIAAEKTGRHGYGIEIDPLYCDVTIRRLHIVCGLEAVLEGTAQRFAEVEALRAATAG